MKASILENGLNSNPDSGLFCGRSKLSFKTFKTWSLAKFAKKTKNNVVDLKKNNVSQDINLQK